MFHLALLSALLSLLASPLAHARLPPPPPFLPRAASLRGGSEHGGGFPSGGAADGGYATDPAYDAYSAASPAAASPSAYSAAARLSRRVSRMGTSHRQLGFGLCAAGLVTTALGVMLFMHKQLLRLGNLMFVAGFPLVVGPGRTAGYFLQPEKARATSCLLLGVLLVFWGRPLLGLILEVFGMLNLFGNLFPLVFAMVRRLPVVGDLLSGGAGGGTGRRGREEYGTGGYDYGGGSDYGSEYGGNEYGGNEYGGNEYGGEEWGGGGGGDYNEYGR
ncbi:hypothetical protein TeGR_g7467 [Tetraparma gracilis]|uniref:Uncharacterized protein n=1 Tax=Tetraparma gracilis TaxID=2962635 RepID=A0ABQ6N802_9STRA|nr:hypothetical protein TeGR_g7467 [Tetraparma gracilis]